MVKHSPKILTSNEKSTNILKRMQYEWEDGVGVRMIERQTGKLFSHWNKHATKACSEK